MIRFMSTWAAVDDKVILTPPCIFCMGNHECKIQGGVRMTCNVQGRTWVVSTIKQTKTIGVSIGVTSTATE